MVERRDLVMVMCQCVFSSDFPLDLEVLDFGNGRACSTGFGSSMWLETAWMVGQCGSKFVVILTIDNLVLWGSHILLRP